MEPPQLTVMGQYQVLLISSCWSFAQVFSSHPSTLVSTHFIPISNQSSQQLSVL